MNPGIIIFVIAILVLFVIHYYSNLKDKESFAPYQSDFYDVMYPEMMWNNPTRFTKYMSYDLRGGIPPMFYPTGPWNQSPIF